MKYERSLWGALDSIPNRESISRLNFDTIEPEQKDYMCRRMINLANRALISSDDEQLVELTKRLEDLEANGIVNIQYVSSVEKYLYDNGFPLVQKKWNAENFVTLLPISSESANKSTVCTGDLTILVPHRALLLVEEDPLRLMHEIVHSYASVIHYHDSYKKNNRLTSNNVFSYLYVLYSNYEKQATEENVRDFVSCKSKRAARGLANFYKDSCSIQDFDNLNPQIKLNPPDEFVINGN